MTPAMESNNGALAVSQALNEGVVAQAKAREVISISNFNFSYGENQVLFDINLAVPEKEIVALIGPSGCGKSTLACAA